MLFPHHSINITIIFSEPEAHIHHSAQARTAVVEPCSILRIARLTDRALNFNSRKQLFLTFQPPLDSTYIPNTHCLRVHLFAQPLNSGTTIEIKIEN